MKRALKYGTIITLGIAGWVLADHFWLHFSSPDSKGAFLTPVFFNVLTILVLSLGIRKSRRENNGLLTMGQGIRAGLSISLVYALLASGFFLLLYLIVGPKLLENEAGAFGSDKPDNYVLLQAFAGLFFSAMIGGLLYSAIISLLLKRRQRVTS